MVTVIHERQKLKLKNITHLYLIFQTICYRTIKATIQNDMHYILWVLQFTLGQSVMQLLLAPPVPI